MGGHVVVGRELDVLSSSSEQLPRLIEFVKTKNEKGVPHLIFAIWHGKHRTDAFLVNAETLLKVLGNARSK